MRIAAIDVGSNSVHLVVAEVAADGRLQIIERAREQVELGAGGLERSEITPEAFQRGVDALTNFHHTLRSLRVEAVHTAATSAVREASNGEDFCRAVRNATGLHLRIVTGHDEARLIWLGARDAVDFRAGPALLVDLGGGSIEFVLCTHDRTLAEASLPLGHIRMAERFHQHDPMGRTELADLRAHLRGALERLPRALRGRSYATMVATSGAARTLARMATLARGGQPEHDHGLLLHRGELDLLVHELTTRRASRFSEIPGMDPKRRRTLPAAAVVFSEVMTRFGADQLLTSEFAMREGLLHDWIRSHRPELDLSERVRDPRRRSVLAMLERYRVDRRHADQVARLARQIFDQTAHLHHLPDSARELLEFAALCHDVGHYIAGEDHHRHGQYLVRHTPLAGFTEPDIAMLASLVRFHRGGRPKVSHPEVAAMSPVDRQTLGVLSGILRIADGLDRSHAQLVDDIALTTRGSRLVWTAWTTEPAPLERWSALRRADVLSDALDRECVVRVEERIQPATADSPPRA